MKKYDLCIIGAGSGGLTVAAVAAQMGANVVLIERDKMGGDCLNYGCVPSKALLAAAKTAQGFRTAKKFGIENQEPKIDFDAVKNHVHNVIAQIAPHDSQERFEGLGVTVLRGDGRFSDRQTVEVNGQKIMARKFVIATGSRAAIPPLPGLDGVPHLTNETVFDVRKKPDHLLIIGGGPIGAEMAQAHARLGCKVTVVEMTTLLSKDDPEMVGIIRQQLLAEGIDLREKTGVERVEKQDEKIILHLDDGKMLEGSHLLLATGRRANTENLNLDAAGVETEKGFIKTDAGQRTSNKKIFAIGDCAQGLQFTHAAGYHASVVLSRALFHIPAKSRMEGFPYVIYTDPELAQAGLTEKQARAKHGEKVKTLSFDLKENDRARAEGRTEGRIKVTALPNGKILGCTIVAPEAGEHIQLWSLALSEKMKIGDIAKYVSPYPTMGEMSKRVAGEFFKPVFFGPLVKKIVRFMRIFG